MRCKLRKCTSQSSQAWWRQALSANAPSRQVAAHLLVALAGMRHRTENGHRLVLALDPDLVEFLPGKPGGLFAGEEPTTVATP